MIRLRNSPLRARFQQLILRLGHDDFGLNQAKIMIETSDISDVSMNVIDSKKLEQDAGGKAAQRPTFPHPATRESDPKVGTAFGANPMLKQKDRVAVLIPLEPTAL
jgi:hypothetical protein